MRFTLNNRRRSVLVRVPVGRGPLSTVKHICFVSIFLLNLTGPPGGPNGFKLLLLCAGCGDRAWHLRHSRLIQDLLPQMFTLGSSSNAILTHIYYQYYYNYYDFHYYFSFSSSILLLIYNILLLPGTCVTAIPLRTS